jgi:hypothetical protein
MSVTQCAIGMPPTGLVMFFAQTSSTVMIVAGSGGLAAVASIMAIPTAGMAGMGGWAIDWMSLDLCEGHVRLLGGSPGGHTLGQLLLLAGLLGAMVLAYPRPFDSLTAIVAGIAAGATVILLWRALAGGRGRLADGSGTGADPQAVCPACGEQLRKYSVACSRCGTVLRSTVMLAYSAVVLLLLAGSALWRIGGLTAYTAGGMILILLIAGVLLRVGHIRIGHQRK